MKKNISDLQHLLEAESKVANDQHVRIVPTSWSSNGSKVVCVRPIEVHDPQHGLEMEWILVLSQLI